MTKGQVGPARLVPFLWGVQFVTSKQGLNSFPPLLFVGLRFMGIAVLLLPFVGRPARDEWPALAGVSLFYGSLCFGLFFAGLHLSQAGMAAVLAQLMTPFTLLFAWPLLHERPTIRVAAGVAAAFVGAALALAGSGFGASIGGAVLVTAGAASQGLGNILVRRLASIPPLRLIGWMAALAAPQLLAASAFLEHGQLTAMQYAALPAWASLAYTVLLGGIAAFALWFCLLRELPLARVAPFALLQTVFGIAAAALLLSEPLTSSPIGGALICMAGVALTQTPTNTTPDVKDRDA